LKLQLYAVVYYFHAQHFAFAGCNHLNDFSGIFFREIDAQLFDRFATNAVYFFENYLWLSYLKFEPLVAWYLSEWKDAKHLFP
jgi:hypothetical protein